HILCIFCSMACILYFSYSPAYSLPLYPSTTGCDTTHNRLYVGQTFCECFVVMPSRATLLSETVSFSYISMSLLVYRLVHAPVTRESWVRLPGREFFLNSRGTFLSSIVPT